MHSASIHDKLVRTIQALILTPNLYERHSPVIKVISDHLRFQKRESIVQ